MSVNASVHAAPRQNAFSRSPSILAGPDARPHTYTRGTHAGASPRGVRPAAPFGLFGVSDIASLPHKATAIRSPVNLRLSLHGDWRLKPIDAPRPLALPPEGIDAPIPGTVHTALIRAGLIAHPDAAFAELDQRWVGQTSWQFTRDFSLDDVHASRRHALLLAEGLDCIARVDLNGVTVGHAANAFHEHRFDVRHALRPGPNRLTVTLDSPLAHARALRERLGPRPVNGDWDPFNFIRRPAFNFGWDWGPLVPTAGIWRAISLLLFDSAAIVGLRTLVRLATPSLAKVEVIPTIFGDPRNLSLLATFRDSRREILATGPASGLTLDIPSPALWNPAGYGEPRLGSLSLTLLDSAREVESRSLRLGLRSVELDTSPDPSGERFALLVNSREVFCQGANWIPDTLFPDEASPERTRRRLLQARDAGFNMLRVWGGGLYESDDFYDTCDELGLLVWQDFMFACALYPEEPPFPDLLDAEARSVIDRLSPHPSVALYCGGNECVWGYQRWGWKERLAPGQTWGGRLWTETLPRLLADLDPSRPYWPNSPWSGSIDADVLDPDRGDRHTWEASLDAFRALVPRFLSEFGHQAPATLAAWARSHPGQDPRPGSRASDHRQRATGGSETIYSRALAEHWGERAAALPPEAWVYAAQVVQARAVELAFSWARANRPRCMGALVWQLNDVWTAHSWSLIDADERPKPAYFAARRACRPRALSLHPLADRLALFAVNDTDEAWSEEAVVRRVHFDGRTLASAAFGLDLAPRSAGEVTSDAFARLGAPADAHVELVEARAGACRAMRFHAPDRLLRYPEARLGIDFDHREGHVRVRLKADALVRDLSILADVLDPKAVVSDQGLTLLPGDEAVIEVRGLEGDPTRLAGPPALWSAADLCRLARG